MMNHALQARWLVPIDRPPIAGGIVSVSDGRIVAVGENVSGRPPTDMGDVALLPGFVNAHTHLEFSLLDRPLGRPAMPFPQWIAAVIAWRRDEAARFQGGESRRQAARREAIVAGLTESNRAGCAAVGDILTPGLPQRILTSGQRLPHCVAFLELLGLSPERAKPLISLAEEYLAGPLADVERGLSPHAPYTVGPRLLQTVCRLSQKERVPLAIHLAETRDELALLRDHSGPLVEFLASLGAWYPEVLPLGLRPLNYLEMLEVAYRSLVVHGNYLADDELEFLAARRSRMSVVYCPRTHDYFGHDPYPLQGLLSAGVSVAVGTDSRASNPDLSVLAELRHVRTHHPGLSPEEILRLGTLAGAQALGIDREFGSIAVGKRSVFALVELPGGTADPFEPIVADSGGVTHYPSCSP